MWSASDWVECLIFIELALMFVYTVFVTARFFRRYHLARRELRAFSPDSTGRSLRRKNFVAELSRGVGTLQSIASSAPFLGLAAMVYGILALFFRGYVGSRQAYVGTISAEVSAALVATAAGLLVAMPAAVCYNILRTRLEKVESRQSALLGSSSRAYGFAQTLPLRRRFSGLPAFALIGAPVLAILVPSFALFQRFQIPKGLFVRPQKIVVSDHNLGAIVVSVTSKSVSGPCAVYVNARETTWDELGNALRGHLKGRPHWVVYVEGASEVAWADVAKAIDVARGLHAEVVLLTVELDSVPNKAAKSKQRMK